MRKNLSIVLTVFLVLSVPAAAQQPKPQPFGDLQLSADALGSAVIDKTIEIMMRDGTYIRGKVFQATQNELFVRIKKSEPKGRIRGSEAAIRTSDVAAVHMRKSGTIAAPIALGVLGGILGAVGGAYVAYAGNSQAAGGLLLFSLGSAGGATCGALLGREVVKKTITISVLPR